VPKYGPVLVLMSSGTFACAGRCPNTSLLLMKSVFSSVFVLAHVVSSHAQTTVASLGYLRILPTVTYFEQATVGTSSFGIGELHE